MIEILIVIVIMAVIAAMGVQLLSSNSIERQILNQVHNFKASIKYACDQAVFQNSIYGVNFYKNGYGFSRFAQNQWVVQSNEFLPTVQLDEDWQLELMVDGQRITLEEDLSQTPKTVSYTHLTLPTTSRV